jgi:hypothetical protein
MTSPPSPAQAGLRLEQALHEQRAFAAYTSPGAAVHPKAVAPYIERKERAAALLGHIAAHSAPVAELRVPVERDKYLCRLLVAWSVRENNGEDHCSPPEHILRGLIRCAEERKQALRERDAQLAAAEQALKCVETVMMLVEPRSNKADYLAALAEARAVLAAIKEQP